MRAREQRDLGDPIDGSSEPAFFAAPDPAPEPYVNRFMLEIRADIEVIPAAEVATAEEVR